MRQLHYFKKLRYKIFYYLQQWKTVAWDAVVGQPYQPDDKHGIHHSIHLSYRMVSQEPASETAVQLAAMVLERSTFTNINTIAKITKHVTLAIAVRLHWQLNVELIDTKGDTSCG